MKARLYLLMMLLLLAPTQLHADTNEDQELKEAKRVKHKDMETLLENVELIEYNRERIERLVRDYPDSKQKAEAIKEAEEHKEYMEIELKEIEDKYPIVKEKRKALLSKKKEIESIKGKMGEIQKLKNTLEDKILDMEATLHFNGPFLFETEAERVKREKKGVFLEREIKRLKLETSRIPKKWNRLDLIYNNLTAEYDLLLEDFNIEINK